MTPHVGDIIARILNRRLEHRIERVTGENQFGFRKGRETRNELLKIISKRAFEIKEELCVYKKHLTGWTRRSSWKKIWRVRTLIILHLLPKVKVCLDHWEINIPKTVETGSICVKDAAYHLPCPICKKNGQARTLADRITETIKYTDNILLLTKEEKTLQKYLMSWWKEEEFMEWKYIGKSK